MSCVVRDIFCAEKAMEQIIHYLSDILPILTWSLPVLVLWRVLAVRQMKEQGRTTTACHEIGAALLGGAYIYILMQTVVLSGRLRAPSLDGANLIPFKVIGYTVSAFTDGNVTPLLINFLGNILVFAPIGFLYGLCYRGTGVKRAALIGFLCSLTAEAGQLFNERCTDVDDLWMNTLGAVLGFGLYLLVATLLPRPVEKFKVR